ncbi:MAG: N-6 DNA methylase [Chloroflexi bacterium]|nr:N-6 DNA methylase [Chloroflexota bacterium]
MAAPPEIVELVDRFEEQHEAYRSGRYKEAQLRQEFINPFFKALGWDVYNEHGYAEAYKDVIHEDALKISGVTKAPDYCFRIGGTRKFFVEAKKPSVHIKDDISASYQLRRYAWSAKLPLSILTDFDEFAVYDCLRKPSHTDKASVGRVMLLGYKDYSPRWDEIAAIFSREAVLKGSFDKYAESSKGKRGTAEVDDAFLEEIEAWRASLAQEIYRRNPHLRTRELNAAVQATINRIVFLRICEARGIEPYGLLLGLTNGPHVYERLGQLFRSADERYNSGLFHFRPEKSISEPPDEWTLSLAIDDKPLKDILKNLYYPESPYEFSVLPADILGQVYEQFLGKIIRLTAGHRAVVEDKPEVKKAGGVYYTPTYIVDYIVKQTVGKILEGKRPGLRGSASQLRILDPACGSGSFLIGAYQYLLDWHRDRYVADGPERHRRELYQGPGGDWRLTTSERKRILLNNIYGVDIDAQAVETTKLSLLLKVLEGESEQTVTRQLAMFHERALPDLANNIKCGNSLIGPDFYDNQQASFLDEEERNRVNVFDWQGEFPEVFGGGNPGFDVVIGNPPYLSFSGRQCVDLPDLVRTHLFRTYESRGWPTSHGFFIERSMKFLSRRLTSFIVPDQVGHLAGYETVRESVTGCAGLVDVAYWGENVFANVVTPALTFVADSAYRGDTAIREIGQDDQHVMVESGQPWTASRAANLIQKVRADSISLAHLVADPGVHTGNCSKHLVLPVEAATPDSVPVLEGKQVSRYRCDRPAKVLRLGYIPKAGEYFTIRSDGKYASAGFVIRQTAAYPIVGPRDHATYFRNSLLALYSPDDQTSVLYVVGILNSSLMRYVYSTMVKESHQKVFPQVKVKALRDLPIRPVSFSDPVSMARHDKMVAWVEQMLALHRQLSGARANHDKAVLQRQIDALDKRIDATVYELYALTGEEVKLVEEAAQVQPIGAKTGDVAVPV